MKVYVGKLHSGEESQWFGAYKDRDELIEVLGNHILVACGYMDQIETYFDILVKKNKNYRSFYEDLGIEYSLFEQKKNDIECGKDFVHVFKKELCCSEDAIDIALENTSNYIYIIPFGIK
tara:strand:+ start:384 stop:743 length:360 start_codon:yes stop_codon:yes gene_type:complete